MPPKLKLVSAVSFNNNSDDGCPRDKLEIPDSRQHDIGKYSGPPEQQQNIKMYLSSLSELEQRVCDIAKDHLKSSFDISRSSGFVAWKAKNT